MAQIHYIVYFDTETEEWMIEHDSPENFLMPDGMVWNWAGSGTWDLVDNSVGWNEYGEGEKKLRAGLGEIEGLGS